MLLVDLRDGRFDRGLVGPWITSIGPGVVEQPPVDRRHAATCPARDLFQDVVVRAHVFLPPGAISPPKPVFTHHGLVRHRFEAGLNRLVARQGGPMLPAGILLNSGPERIPRDAPGEILAFVGRLGVTGVRMAAITFIVVLKPSAAEGMDISCELIGRSFVALPAVRCPQHNLALPSFGCLRRAGTFRPFPHGQFLCSPIPLGTGRRETRASTRRACRR